MGRIVVVGCYIVGLSMFVERIPRAGETVRGRDFVEGPGGKGSNQAVAAARLGGDVAFVGCVGRDRYGAAAAALLEREGVDITHLARVDRPTATGFVVIDGEGRNAISITEDASGALDAGRVESAAAALLDEASVLLTQWEMPLAPVRRAIALAHDRGGRAIWNPAPAGALSEPLAGLDLLTPNESEARTLADLDPRAEVTDAELGRLLRDRLSCDVVLTLGERGALIVDGRPPRYIPAPSVQAVDTTGAGDAFNAGFAVALASGAQTDEAVQLGCAAGAYSVMTPGTVASYPTRAELDAFVLAHS